MESTLLPKLASHHHQTFLELTNLLVSHDKVAVVRPTGYGKTRIVGKLCETVSDGKLIIAPLSTIVDYLDRFFSQDKTITLSTYQKLLTFESTEAVLSFFGEGIGYIFLDEAHHLGASQWSSAVNLLLCAYPNAKVVGLTATPLRADGFNIVDTFFKGIQVSPMTLLDAIADELLVAPIYVSALYTLKDEVKQRADQIRDSKRLSDSDKQLRLKQLHDVAFNVKKLKNIPTILRTYLNEHPASALNMKFIVFCPSIEVLLFAEKTVQSWFNKAYPSRIINIFSVHSALEVGNMGSVVADFESQRDSNHIDLLFAVNMINEGVHLNSVTGAILLRKTTSSVIYQQQIGRVVSIRGVNRPIIFDFVNSHLYVKGSYISELKSFIDNLPVQSKLGERRKEVLKSALIHVHDDVSEVMDILNRVVGDLLAVNLPFQPWEDAVTKQHYPSGGYKAVQSHGVNRSLSSIKYRAATLGVVSGLAWKPWEDDILKQHYPLGGSKAVQAHGVNRSSEAVNARANKLGVASDLSWKPWEDDILKQYYPSGGSKAVQAHGVNRSPGSINGRASGLGVAFDSSWNPWEDDILKHHYSLGGIKAVQSRGVNRSGIAIQSRAYKLGVSSAYHFKSWEDDIIKEHYQLGGVEAVQAHGVNRSPGSIQARAASLGVSTNSRWQPWEDDIVKQHYPSGGVKAVQAHGINRTELAIHRRVKLLSRTLRP